jgi:hypothetical protein
VTRPSSYYLETMQTMEKKLEPYSKILTLLALSCSLAVSSTAAAHPGVAGHRHAVVTATPHVIVAQAPRVIPAASRVARPAARATCATSGCSGEVTRTGRHGNTVARSGGASCADGACSRDRTVTGPNGGTATVNREITR